MSARRSFLLGGEPARDVLEGGPMVSAPVSNRVKIAHARVLLSGLRSLLGVERGAEQRIDLSMAIGAVERILRRLGEP